jgi:hypothetical protein
VKRAFKKLLRRGWRGVHRLAPSVAERIDDRRRARFRTAAAVQGVVQYEERIQALERDLALVSGQLAVLAMRLEHTTAQSRTPGEGEEQRLQRARLSAISFYEERMSRLEEAAGIAPPPDPPEPPSSR